MRRVAKFAFTGPRPLIGLNPCRSGLNLLPAAQLQRSSLSVAAQVLTWWIAFAESGRLLGVWLLFQLVS